MDNLEKEVEETKEPIIGEFKPKRKFLNFISSVNGAKIRFIRDIAFVEGKKLSGMLEGAIFKITICDEGTIKFEEQVEEGKEPQSNPEMVKRLIADIDDLDVTGYAQKFVVSGLPFKDINGDLCYLEVEHKKPIDLLASIFNDEEEKEENMNLSEKGLSVLDQLFAEEEKVDKVTSILDELFPDNEDTETTEEVEVVEEVEDTKSVSLSYMEESFRKMNEAKVKELESRIEEKTKDITKFNIDIKQAETKLQETEEQLGVLQTRLETMTPGDEPNGYFFLVSDEQKLETGLDETTKNIADKIADIMKLKKDVLFKYLTGGYYNISIGKKDDITSEIEDKELTKLVAEKVLVIDPSGKFTFDEVNGRTVVQYRGDLNWHQLTSKLIRKGFEQDEEFDKLAGSNSYETKTEEVETPTDVTDSDFDEVKTETKSSSTKEFMTIGEWNTPTNLVVLGTSSYNDVEFKETLSITDGTESLDIRRGGKKMKAFTSIETAGSISVISFDEYKKFISEVSEDGRTCELEFMSGVFEALLLPNFVGKLEIGIKQNGNWITDKSILTKEFVGNLPGVEQILLNIQEGQKVIQIEDHAKYKKSDNKEMGDYKVLESYNTPTDFVIVGVDYDGRDIEITDDYYRADVYLNGKPFQLSSWGCGFETEGHVSIMTINRYKKWVKEFDAMNEGVGVEAVLVTGFTGDVTVGCKTEDGEFSTDFDFGDYILHQVDGGEEVIINLIDKSGDVGIHQIENHDLNKIAPYVRDMRLKEILGEK